MLACASAQKRKRSLPEKTNDTVVQVCVAEVVGWDPNVTCVSYELTHESCPLTTFISTYPTVFHVRE